MLIDRIIFELRKNLFTKLFTYRDPADKLIRHRACSLRDNAYALIKAELDSDFEDKCRKISKNRKIQQDTVNKDKSNPKVDLVHTLEKGDKKDVTNNVVVLNGKKFPSSRKRRIPAWARGYVKKVHKKKKISFNDSTNHDTSNNKSIPASNETSGQSIDLEKFQEFETEAHNVLNGHVPIYDNTDSENDSRNESTKVSQLNHSDGLIDKNSFEKENQNELESMDISIGDDDKVLENNSSNNSSRRESLNVDELSFALDSDSSLTNSPEENDKIMIDKSELDNVFTYTVKTTENFPIELLCDIYVQLSRRVGQYARSYDRKALPKVNIYILNHGRLKVNSIFNRHLYHSIVFPRKNILQFFYIL